MQEYVSLRSGHMEFLIRALDGDPGTDHVPTLPSLPTTIDPALIREAVAYLRRTSLPIAPRKQWPAGGMPQYRLSGQIAAGLQAQPGKALCIWGDADGAVWFDKASTTTGISRMNWSKLVRSWCESGTRNQRPLG